MNTKIMVLHSLDNYGMMMVQCTSDKPRSYVGNYVGPYIMVGLLQGVFGEWDRIGP